MQSYQSMQAEFDLAASDPGKDQAKLEKLAVTMSELLAVIESERAQWLKSHEAAKTIKERLDTIEDALTDEKAELVATASLLDQNDRIRSQIQQEERAKAQELIAAELNQGREALQRERDTVLGTLQSEVALEKSELKLRLTKQEKEMQTLVKTAEDLKLQVTNLREYADTLENRLVDAEMAHEMATADLDRVQKESETKVASLQMTVANLERELATEADEVKRADGARRDAEGQKKTLYRAMMEAFELERRDMVAAIKAGQSLLGRAAQVHLPTCLPKLSYLTICGISSIYRRKMKSSRKP